MTSFSFKYTDVTLPNSIDYNNKKWQTKHKSFSYKVRKDHTVQQMCNRVWSSKGRALAVEKHLNNQVLNKV